MSPCKSDIDELIKNEIVDLKDHFVKSTPVSCDKLLVPKFTFFETEIRKKEEDASDGENMAVNSDLDGNVAPRRYETLSASTQPSILDAAQKWRSGLNLNS